MIMNHTFGIVGLEFSLNITNTELFFLSCDLRKYCHLIRLLNSNQHQINHKLYPTHFIEIQYIQLHSDTKMSASQSLELWVRFDVFQHNMCFITDPRGSSHLENMTTKFPLNIVR